MTFFPSRIVTALFSLSVASLSACSSDSDSSSTPAAAQTLANGICTYPVGQTNPGVMCAQINDATDDQRAAFETLVCNAGEITGTYTAGGSCPTADVVHTCDINVVALAFTFNLSFFANHTTETGTAFCDNFRSQASASGL